MLSNILRASFLSIPLLFLAGCIGGGGSSSGLGGSGAAAGYAGEYFGGGINSFVPGGSNGQPGSSQPGISAFSLQSETVPGGSNPGAAHNPEPASLALLGGGLALVASRRRRKS